MIYIKEKNILSAVKKAFLALYKERPLVNDTDVWKEDSAVLEIKNPLLDKEAFHLKNNHFIYKFEFEKYFPYVDPKLKMLECKNWDRLFLKSNLVKLIQKRIKSHPESRRLVISTWKNKLNSSRPAPCLTQLYFRIRNNRLEVHSHARATDAFRLLLMDMQFGIFLQRMISRKNNLKVGNYIHFIDALHFYKKFRKDIKKQYHFMREAKIWKNI